MLFRQAYLVVALMLVCAAVFAQDYPTRTVRIVTAEAGGSNDIATRIIAQPLGAALGQQFIVENMGQASGVIAAQTVAKAAPDGYTLILYGASLWLLPFFRDNVPFDLARDFAPVSWTNRGPNLLVVHPSLPVKTVRELIVLARARPGALNYGSSSLGAANHLAAELFKTMARVDIVHIPYKGTAPALNDVIGGQLQVMFPNAPSAGAAREVGQAARAGDHQRAAVAAVSGTADRRRDRPARLRSGVDLRRVRAGENAAGDRREAQCRNRPRACARRGEGALRRPRRRDRRRHARRVRRGGAGGDREVGQGHPRRRHPRGIKSIFRRRWMASAAELERNKKIVRSFKECQGTKDEAAVMREILSPDYKRLRARHGKTSLQQRARAEFPGNGARACAARFPTASTSSRTSSPRATASA